MGEIEKVRVGSEACEECMSLSSDSASVSTSSALAKTSLQSGDHFPHRIQILVFSVHGNVQDSRTIDFSVSAGYYIQATLLWPLGGNPHNQVSFIASCISGR